MNEAVETVLERRRLRRKLTFWRVGALLVLGALVIALFARSEFGKGLTAAGSDQIARVRISGFISNDRDLIELLDKLKDRKQVKAVILDISSTGGSTVGGEAIYEAVRRLASEKPVAASVGTLAASAAYMIACGTDHIVAYRTSIVGSIGVLFQYGDVSALLDRLGVKIDAVKSTPLKAEPSFFKPASEESKQMMAAVVGSSYEWFVGVVAERRKLDQARARELASGAVFTGEQGIGNGLIDAIGDEQTAKAWLVAERGIEPDLKIREWKPRRDSYVSNPVSVARLAGWLGLRIGETDALALADYFERRVFIDGLVSVLQVKPAAE
jgi:protease-4